MTDAICYDVPKDLGVQALGNRRYLLQLFEKTEVYVDVSQVRIENEILLYVHYYMHTI